MILYSKSWRKSLKHDLKRTATNPSFISYNVLLLERFGWTIFARIQKMGAMGC